MSVINWKPTQQKLLAAGFNPGPVDGLKGKSTYAALLGYVAGRQPDAAMRAISIEMTRQLPRFGVDCSPERLAEWLAETAHETGGYRVFEENMHYSAKRLMEVWPSRFKTLQVALAYAWDPTDPDREDVALANLVYGSRMGNQLNGTDDDDGWDHRGSGLLQHTGAGEYALLRQRLGYEPDDVRDPGKAVLAACDYWLRANMNSFIDRNDYRGARRAVNGGYIGVEDVAAKRVKALKVIA